MNLLKPITYKSLIFLLFLLLHIFLFNINAAEWGDSYRILRAAEFIKDGSYPEDEKRPPLYSIILALSPASVDQVIFGRILMLFISLLTFVVFYLLLHFLTSDEKVVNYSLLFFTLNPVYLYWSLRIMADVFFTLLVLLSFYIFLRFKDHLNIYKSGFLGAVVSLAVLTRFEGYLLFVAIFIGILLSDTLGILNLEGIKNSVLRAKKNLTQILFYSLCFFLVQVPWLIYRNPLNSKYFDEPSGRAYDLKMVAIYFASLFFIFGFVYGFYFLLREIPHIRKFFNQKLAILTFTLSELFLILLWPAAIPRLFTPLVPFLAIILAICVVRYFDSGNRNYLLKDGFYLFVLISIYVISQYFLRLQFNVLSKETFLVVVMLQILIFPTILFRKQNYFIFLTIVSMIIWSLSSIYIHKDIFISVKNASEYMQKNYQGTVIFNDVSSVPDWYFNFKDKDDSIIGRYYNTEKKANLTFEALEKENPDYLLITNEHNTTMELDLEKRPYLEELKMFKYQVNKGEFFAKIIRFNKDFEQ